MFFKQIFEPKLAQYSYIIGCQQTREAVVIDPMRDIDRYIDIANTEGLKIVASAETHIHADYLSGLKEFGDRLNIQILVSDEGTVDWKYEWVRTKERAVDSSESISDYFKSTMIKGTDVLTQDVCAYLKITKRTLTRQLKKAKDNPESSELGKTMTEFGVQYIIRKEGRVRRAYFSKR